MSICRPHWTAPPREMLSPIRHVEGPQPLGDLLGIGENAAVGVHAEGELRSDPPGIGIGLLKQLQQPPGLLSPFHLDDPAVLDLHPEGLVHRPDLIDDVGIHDAALGRAFQGGHRRFPVGKPGELPRLVGETRLGFSFAAAQLHGDIATLGGREANFPGPLQQGIHRQGVPPDHFIIGGDPRTLQHPVIEATKIACPHPVPQGGAHRPAVRDRPLGDVDDGAAAEECPRHRSRAVPVRRPSGAR